MKFFKVGDRVRTIKGNGTVIAKHEPTIMPSETYTVELDNGKGIYQFYRWELEHIAHQTEKGGEKE